MKPYPSVCISIAINHDRRVEPIEDYEHAAHILEAAGMVEIEEKPSPYVEGKTVLWLRDKRPLTREEIIQALLTGGINNDKKPFGIFRRKFGALIKRLAKHLRSKPKAN